jgi:hypothetical protein
MILVDVLPRALVEWKLERHDPVRDRFSPIVVFLAR